MITRPMLLRHVDLLPRSDARLAHNNRLGDRRTLLRHRDGRRDNRLRCWHHCHELAALGNASRHLHLERLAIRPDHIHRIARTEARRARDDDAVVLRHNRCANRRGRDAGHGGHLYARLDAGDGRLLRYTTTAGEGLRWTVARLDDARDDAADDRDNGTQEEEDDKIAGGAQLRDTAIIIAAGVVLAHEAALVILAAPVVVRPEAAAARISSITARLAVVGSARTASDAVVSIGLGPHAAARCDMGWATPMRVRRRLSGARPGLAAPEHLGRQHSFMMFPSQHRPSDALAKCPVQQASCVQR